MSREPGWQGPGDTNWGLPPHRWSSALADSLKSVGRVLDVISLWTSHARARKVFRRVNGPKIALGSGSTPPEGWHGLDLSRKGPQVHRADLLLGIPAANGTVAAILAEHVLEHLFLDDLPRLLAECRRVMRPAGVIRVVSPDAMTIARLLTLAEQAEAEPVVVADARVHRWDDHGFIWARTVNRVSHQWGQHRSLLTAPMVARLLTDAGFVGVRSMLSAQTHYFDRKPPDVHPLRFPDEDPEANFAVEALVPEQG